jgi:hypothetical protein
MAEIFEENPQNYQYPPLPIEASSLVSIPTEYIPSSPPIRMNNPDLDMDTGLNQFEIDNLSSCS